MDYKIIGETVPVVEMKLRAGETVYTQSGGMAYQSEGIEMKTNARGGIKMGNFQVIDHMVNDSLTDAFSGVHMGVTAENIANKYGITRQEQDEFAIASQQKAIAAVDSGAFKDEIVPVTIKTRKESRFRSCNSCTGTKENKCTCRKVRFSYGFSWRVSFIGNNVYLKS